ncbi:MarR family winged helix-turn-helix transcriptional regulator [uncultured Methanobrevibacter sp.]|uniref:MarR family winged helix-turn-helix transcriptional regulator n=1 Tax=uncultured Methanobrevibacter sp. TaxID=253161 RepID=UPI0025CDCCBC|nr:MarR family winged helix-turn-helix transcriptional regulator [uncultured Methanobrevibacter sp.]
MSEKKLGFLIGDLFYTYTNYLNNALKEMDIEKKEFLTKEIDPDDNRKKIIKITSKGKEIQKFAFKTNEEIENKLNLQIGEKEMADLKIKLEELIILIDS